MRDQFLLPPAGTGLSCFFFLLEFLAQAGFKVTQAGLGFHVAAAKGFFGLSLGFRAKGVQFHLPLLVALA